MYFDKKNFFLLFGLFQFESVLKDNSSTWANQIASRVHYQYLQLVDQMPSALCGRKVLAGIVMKTKQKRGKKDAVQVIALGTGEHQVASLNE